ncbi:MAG: 3-deoxy-D-manno-octulosonic acid transferase [Planctomycetaceae bacterium]
MLFDWLLNLVWSVVLVLAAPWLAYRRWIRKKRFGSWRQKLFGQVPCRTAQGRCLWFHAVSVGEVIQLSSVLTELRREDPHLEIAISTTTTTGYEVAQQRFPGDLILFWPLDFSWAVSEALNRIRPDLVILVELELWPNFLRIAERRGIPVALINGRITERSFRGYRRLGAVAAGMLSRVGWLAVQNQVYADRFRQLGAPEDRIRITGSIKFDGVKTDRLAPEVDAFRRLLGLPRDAQVFLAGSTHPSEEKLALEAWLEVRAEFPELYLLLAPRHAERFAEVATLVEQQFRLPLLRRSQIASPRTSAPEQSVVLLDTLGELSRLWGLASVAFVGGSLVPRGGQSMIEPAGFGVPVIIGPQTWNFADVVAQLQSIEGVQTVANGGELAGVLRFLLQHPEEARAQGERAQALIVASQGATQAIAAGLMTMCCRTSTREVLPGKTRESRAA